ncbi:MAG: SIMPL domain-containing protein [Bacillota bacterium]
MSESLNYGALPHNSMTLTGQGQVTTVPDLAVIRLGVQSTGSDLEATQAENSQISQEILDALMEMGVTDIKTFQYTIDKFYEQVNGNTVDRGYTIRHIFEIRTEEMGNIGEIIDTAVNAGANIVDLISFEVSNPNLYYEQALNIAVMNAIEKAKSIARNLNIKINPIPIKITENSFVPRPFQSFQRELAATPIVPGNIMIEAMVTAEFEY